MRILAGVVVVWLIIGAIAAGQRGYYSRSSTNCAQAGTVAVTILAGPLNYVGVNPKAKCLIPAQPVTREAGSAAHGYPPGVAPGAVMPAAGRLWGAIARG